MDIINRIDFDVLNLIHNRLSCGALDWLMPKITFLGNGGLLWIATAVVMICIKKYRRIGVALIIGLLVGVIIGNLILKNAIARERPCWINDTVQLLIAMPNDYSFPSGHTLSSFAAATILFFYHKKMGIAAGIFAVLIAFSRLYLYVHFPTDILGGGILGVLIGVAVCILTERYLKKPEEANRI